MKVDLTTQEINYITDVCLEEYKAISDEAERAVFESILKKMGYPIEAMEAFSAFQNK